MYYTEVMNEKFTLAEFHTRFQNDDDCLDEIKFMRFGDNMACTKCYKTNKFYRVNGRMAYACSFCGYQIFPLAGTIFGKSTTPLKSWFFAIYLMAQTRSGMSAKQLERMLGVTYKTAWRMFHQIRKLMADDSDLLTGEVEIDEMYITPNSRFTKKPMIKGDEEVVFGAVERSGRVKVKHIKNATSNILISEVQKSVDFKANVYTDGLLAYHTLYNTGWKHKSVNHQKEYVSSTDPKVHTQNIENLWSNMRRGIRGVYRHVDAKYLQAYIDEYAFRYSNRNKPSGYMFDIILSRVI